MPKVTIEDLNLRDSRVFVRVDFNVPIESGRVGDDLRIREALPTIRYAMEQGAVVVLASHLGRPKGKRNPALTLAPVANHLSQLISKNVLFVPECIGPAAHQAVVSASAGDVILLENLRYHPEEEANDAPFAQRLAELAPLYVNDAFGSAHRAHASTEGITHYVKRAGAGYLMEKELRYLGDALERPARPFIAILGGAKISDKIEVIENLLNKVDRLLIGGAMAFTFLRSQGHGVGKSLCEDDKLDLASQLLARAASKGSPSQILLPVDFVVAAGIDDEKGAQVVEAGKLPPDKMGLDIGPSTLAAYAGTLRNAGTILWNGPMGVFEKAAFAAGTFEIARAVAESKSVSIIGGGDSAAAVRQAGVGGSITHISTGGGASLEFLAGKILPGVAALNDRN